jgi:hypothetical protein
MSGVIPNGVYSLFYQTFSPYSANPICPTVDSTIALTARFPQRQTPDPDSFVADSSGRAFFHARITGRLLVAATAQIWVIYHFDGKTYGRRSQPGRVHQLPVDLWNRRDAPIPHHPGGNSLRVGIDHGIAASGRA